jgi:Tfp pilus assembly protein PilZ
LGNDLQLIDIVMSMKDRDRKKPKDILNVILRDERVGYTATIRDVSEKGISVLSDHVFPTYKIIDILIKIGDKPIQMKGSIRWIKETLPSEENQYNEIGISLINPPTAYLKYFGFDKK